VRILSQIFSFISTWEESMGELQVVQFTKKSERGSASSLVLETPRLVLRPYNRGCTDSIRNTLTNQVIARLGQYHLVNNKTLAHEFVKELCGGNHSFAIQLKDGDIIGCVSARVSHAVHITFWVTHYYWENGYEEEVLSAIEHYGRRTLHFEFLLTTVLRDSVNPILHSGNWERESYTLCKKIGSQLVHFVHYKKF
jgi:Acetyltransferase (GNAT) domain